MTARAVDPTEPPPWGLLRPRVVDERVNFTRIDAWMASSEGLTTPVWLFSPDAGRVLWANQAAQELWETPSLAELRSRQIHEGTSAASLAAITGSLLRVMAGEAVDMWVTMTPAGISKRRFIAHRRFVLPDGMVTVRCEALRDPPVEEVLALAANVSLTVALFSQSGGLLNANLAFNALGIGEPDTRVGLGDLIPPGVTPLAWFAELSADVATPVEVSLRTARGWRWFRAEHRRVCGSGDCNQVLVTLFDITDSREQQAHLVSLAHTDPLTGALNRLGFFERAARRLARTSAYSLLYLDLDGLKQINDTLGHLAGDAVLKGATARIRATLGPDDICGRLGGDEFVILTTNRTDAMAERIRECVDAPIDLGDRRVAVTASIGIALHPEDATDLDELVRCADTAMYDAKKHGRNRVMRWTRPLRDRELLRASIAARLRGAMEAGELRLVVQPVVHLGTGELLGGECLLRWNSPVLGVVPPMEFVTVAEETGLISALSRFVIEAATDILGKMTRTDLRLSINISAREFWNTSLTEEILGPLRQRGISPERLTVELTETASLDQIERTLARLEDLRGAGCWLALDDFGAGYASLSTLIQLPVDVVKLDRSLVGGIPEARSMAVLRGALSMARDLGLRVVAEGVETEAERQALLSLGCEAGQGYLMARPLELPAWFAFVEQDTGMWRRS